MGVNNYMNEKRALYNTVASFVFLGVSIISGLVLPRLILSNFGSDYNGLVNSITQFLSYSSVLIAGVGGATRLALYKTLVIHDNIRTIAILNATKAFVRKVIIVFFVILVIVAALYPLLIINEFNWLFTFSLTLIIGISIIASTFLGATYQALLTADQRRYVFDLIQVCTVALNTVIASLLIYIGTEIRIVMLASSTIFLLNPLMLYLYVRKRYKLDNSIKSDNSAITQRWDALWHHVADLVRTKSSIIILTIFSGLLEVSVYAVYYMVIVAITTLIRCVVNSTEAPLGNLLARGEHTKVRDGLDLSVFLVNVTTAVLLTSTALLIVPFISLYTAGIDDVNYIRPLLAYILCFAALFDIFRVPFQLLVKAAGHFKQTRNGEFIEAAISIIISVFLVQYFCIIGVVIGSLCAMIFRAVRYVVYVSKYLVHRNARVYARKFFLLLLNAAVIITVAQVLPPVMETTFLAWVISATIFALLAVSITSIFIAIFYRHEFYTVIKLIHKIIKKKPR